MGMNIVIEENKKKYMDKIFDKAKDKNVSAVIIYGKNDDIDEIPLAYVDEECTIAMKSSDLKDAFLKRVIIKIGAKYYIPSFMTIVEGMCALVYSDINESGDGFTIKSISSVSE